MRSPLSKRFKRELAANAGKYLGIFAMMVVAIGFTSGFLSAASSIEVLIKGMDDRYSIEDARIEVAEELSEADISAAQDACNDEDAGEVTFTRLFSIDVGFTSENAQKDTSARVYERRIDVDIAAYSEGVAPQDSGEIALDRVFCANNEISVGDEVVVGGRSLTVSGIMTLPDYSALFEDNSDFIFNALTFTVAEVSEEGFDALEESGAAVIYSYALTFANANATAADRSSAESEIAVALDGEGVQVEDLTDKSENKGIGYPEEDVRGDQSMWEVLMALLIVIMSFMFVVLTVSTIDAESAVIGTLLANGWSKRELVIHYATLPCLIGVIAAGIGNVLGYVVLADTMQGLYYNSYSLPPYEPVLSWRVICITTVAPLLLLFVITIVGLVKRMRSTPLQFLRHEKGEGKAGRAPGGVPGERFSWLALAWLGA